MSDIRFPPEYSGKSPRQYASAARTVRNLLKQGKPLGDSDFEILFELVENEQLTDDEIDPALDALEAFLEKMPASSVAHQGVDGGTSPQASIDEDLLYKARKQIDETRRILMGVANADSSIGYEQRRTSLKLLKGHFGSTRARERRQKELILKAKYLSVNREYLSRLEYTRKMFNIEPQLPTLDDIYGKTPHFVLFEYLNHRNPTERIWDDIQKPLNDALFVPFAMLDPVEDYGLVVAALCFGLTPELIWDDSSCEILLYVARQIRPSQYIDLVTSESQRLTGAIMTVAFLAEKLKSRSQESSQQQVFSDDNPISQWIHFANLFCMRLGINVREVPEAIDSILAGPKDLPKRDGELFVRIGRNMTQEEYKDLWPYISLVRHQSWGQPATPNRWRDFHSDVVLGRLVEDGMSTGDAIRHYEQNRQPNSPKLVNNPDNITPAERKSFSDAVKRYQDRVNMKL